MTRTDMLARFRKGKDHGGNRYTACCPVHDDKHPSLSIYFADDGKVLLHCFAGCRTADILDTVGLTYTDLFHCERW